MKQGKTLQEVAVELQHQRESMRDFKAPSPMIQLDDRGLTMVTGKKGSESFPVNPLCMNQLTSWADIPKKYADRMKAEAPELLYQNVNHWLAQQNETRLIRTLGGQARAFLSHRYRIIDNIGVVETVLPIFNEHGITSASQEITDSRLYIKGVSPRKTFEVRKGDKVQFGAVISNSEVGLGAVHVDPLVYTLACENGAIIEDAGLRKFHIGRRLAELDEAAEMFKDDTVEADNKAFFLKLRDTVNAAFDEAQMKDVLQSIEEGATRKLGTGRFLEEVIEVTSKKYGLNDLEGQGILHQLIEGKDLTQWGLSSAVTAYSQQVGSYERATELEKLGGTLATLTEADWKEIAS